MWRKGKQLFYPVYIQYLQWKHKQVGTELHMDTQVDIKEYLQSQTQYMKVTTDIH